MRICLQAVVMTVIPALVAVGQPPVDRNNPAGVLPPQGQPGRPGPQAFLGPPPNAMFSVIDVDGDGVITKAELRRAVLQLKKLDADGDGNITLAEVSPLGGPGRPGGDPAQFIQRVMENDKNGDGQVTMDEVPDNLRPMARDLDLNKDNVITREELNNVVQAMRNQFPGGQAAGPWNNQPGGFRNQPGAVNQNVDPAMMTGRLLRNDRNRDGKLSADELPRQMRGMFQASDDVDRDGSLSPAELQAVVERMGARARAMGAEVDPESNEERGNNRRARNRARDND